MRHLSFLVAIVVLLFVGSVVNAQHWSYPGDIRSHLEAEHNQSIRGLSQEEMLDFHDAIHESEKKGFKNVPTIVMHGSTSCGPCNNWWKNKKPEWKRMGWFVRKVTEIDFVRPLPWYEVTDSDGIKFEVIGSMDGRNFAEAKAKAKPSMMKIKNTWLD